MIGALLLVANTVVAGLPCQPMTQGNVYIFHVGQDGVCASGDSGHPCNAGVPVQFTVGAFGYSFSCSPHMFLWNFGDGATAMTLNPMHTYASAGTYNVSVTISTPSQVMTLVEQVTVVGGIVHADFSAVTNAHAVRIKIDPGDSMITRWILDFGDGQTRLVDDPNPPEVVHNYVNAGHYTVTLTGGLNFGIAHEVVILPYPRSRGARH
jgi:PKD repeat protein